MQNQCDAKEQQSLALPTREESKMTMAHVDGDSHNNDPVNLRLVDADPDMRLHRVVGNTPISDMETQSCAKCRTIFLKMDRSLCPLCVLPHCSISSARGSDCNYIYAFQPLPGKNYKYRFAVVRCGGDQADGHDYCASHHTWTTKHSL